MSEQAQPEAVKKQIVGVCEEISEKNGWTAFSINVGSQYPVRISTKLPALIDAGREIGNQQATWHYKESQGNPNPNKPGSFYMNRYFESVELGDHGSTPATAGGSPAQSRPAESHHEPIALADKDRVISRLSILSTSANYHGRKESTVEDVIATATRLEIWVYRDIDPVPSSGGAATPPPAPAADEPQYVAADDDIPY